MYPRTDRVNKLPCSLAMENRLGDKQPITAKVYYRIYNEICNVQWRRSPCLFGAGFSFVERSGDWRNRLFGGVHLVSFS